MSVSRGKSDSSPASILYHSVRLDCNVHRAFKMFTDNRLVESWLILPYDGSHADIEPRLGGKYELFWEKENSERNSTLGCKVTVIAPDTLLGFEWKGPPEFSRFMNKQPLTHVTVFFMPLEHGKTMVHLVHSGWGDTPEWQQAREWFQKSWSSAFQNLEREAKQSEETPSV